MREWDVESHTLPNGINVVWEHIPFTTSVYMAFWVKAGSQYEAPQEAGLAHLAEHLFFKGSQKRSGIEIARSIEATGGYLNAFTDKEYSCYYVHLLPHYLPQAIEVLTEMLRAPLLSPEDLQREKRVVLEEIYRLKDTPEEWVDELYAQACWDGHPLGHPVLGYPETVERLKREQLEAFVQRLYRPERMLVVAAGNFEPQALLEPLAENWEREERGDPPAEPAPPRFRRRRVGERRGTGQLQLVVGFPACGETHPDSYALLLLETYLGGGMSSRLFQRIREEKGLAYSVVANLEQFREVGTFSIALGTSLDWAEEALELMREEIEKVLEEGIPVDRLEQIKQQVEGSLLLDLETPSDHASWLAWSVLAFGRVLSVEEVLERYRSVSPEDILRVARRYLASEPALAWVGPATEEQGRRWQRKARPRA